MSASFVARSTGEWAFTRWWAGAERGVRFDVGIGDDHTFAVVESARAGEVFGTFDDSRHSVMRGDEVVQALVAEDRMTCGEFGGTFVLGSGDLATWEGF